MSFKSVVQKTTIFSPSFAIYLVREFLRKIFANKCSLHSSEMTRGKSATLFSSTWPCDPPNETLSCKSIDVRVDREYSVDSAKALFFRVPHRERPSPFSSLRNRSFGSPNEGEKSRAWEEEKDFPKRGVIIIPDANERRMGRERGTELRSLNCSGSG